MASVKQKVAAINKKISEVNAGARKLQSAIREQERVNAAAVAQIGAGTRQVQAGIKETSRVVQAAVNKQQSNIRAQAAENTAYTKDFYFGEGKEK